MTYTTLPPPTHCTGTLTKPSAAASSAVGVVSEASCRDGGVAATVGGGGVSPVVLSGSTFRSEGVASPLPGIGMGIAGRGEPPSVRGEEGKYGFVSVGLVGKTP